MMSISRCHFCCSKKKKIMKCITTLQMLQCIYNTTFKIKVLFILNLYPVILESEIGFIERLVLK